jgi:hypothetical protein
VPLRLRVLFVVLGSLAPLATSPSVLAAESLAPPVVGECHDITYAQAAESSDSSASVDCATRHTTMTIHVGSIPESVWSKGSKQRFEYADKICRDAHEAYFGLSPKILAPSMFGYHLYFLPHATEAAAGERFVRCDVARMAGPKLYPLAADPRFTKLTKQAAKCMTARYQFTACTSPHRFYPYAAVTLPRRPPEGREAVVVGRRCQAATGRRAPAVSWPGGNWTDDNLGVCYRFD